MTPEPAADKPPVQDVDEWLDEVERLPLRELLARVKAVDRAVERRAGKKRPRLRGRRRPT